jgi:hypothetical protein
MAKGKYVEKKKYRKESTSAFPFDVFPFRHPAFGPFPTMPIFALIN